MGHYPLMVLSRDGSDEALNELIMPYIICLEVEPGIMVKTRAEVEAEMADEKAEHPDDEWYQNFTLEKFITNCLELWCDENGNAVDKWNYNHKFDCVFPAERLYRGLLPIICKKLLTTKRGKETNEAKVGEVDWEATIEKACNDPFGISEAIITPDGEFHQCLSNDWREQIYEPFVKGADPDLTVTMFTAKT